MIGLCTCVIVTYAIGAQLMTDDIKSLDAMKAVMQARACRGLVRLCLQPLTLPGARAQFPHQALIPSVVSKEYTAVRAKGACCSLSSPARCLSNALRLVVMSALWQAVIANDTDRMLVFKDHLGTVRVRARATRPCDHRRRRRRRKS
jgi:hypothetical protein